jgi:hypothetical protein
MMRILDTTLRTNPTTYEPELMVTLVVPLEPLREGHADLLGDEIYTMVGKEFVTAITDYRKVHHE